MNALEAMTRLIEVGDKSLTRRVHADEGIEQARLEQIELALAICTAMLNTALPVAKYRCFVKIEETFPKTDNDTETTVCGVRMKDIRAALRPLSNARRKVYITIFEQRKDGAEMISGFQGYTRGSSGYTHWLESLSAFDLKDLLA